MLWVGWFGFNAGSALAANGNAGMAMVVTHISAATASLTWMAIEWIRYGRPSLVGTVTGTIAGLATITPASGFVGPLGGLVYGVASGGLCFIAVQAIKQRFRIDDSLDVFAVHGVGGILGTLLTAFFALPALGGLGLPAGATVVSQLGVQALGAGAAVLWAGFASFVILKVILAWIGLRVEAEKETEGLDVTVHGEHAYDY
jgi:Amt family ammonium transporter